MKKGKLYKRARYIGCGEEGAVYRVGEHLVKKIWHKDAFTDFSEEGIIMRIKTVEKVVKQKTPRRFKKYVTTPEFVGFDKMSNYKVTTYHEYIKSEPVPKEMEEIIKELEDTNFAKNIIVGMQLDFVHDKYPTNTIYSKGKL